MTTPTGIDLQKVAAARGFAARAHGDQRYDGKPYVEGHLAYVFYEMGRIIETEGLGGAATQLLQAAWLHDVLEDTKVTRHELVAAFPGVAALVEAVTDEPGPNRKARKLATYPKTRAAGRLAVALKLADRIANVKAALRDLEARNAVVRAGGVAVTDIPLRFLAMYREEFPDLEAGLRYPKHEFHHTWGRLAELLFPTGQDLKD